MGVYLLQDTPDYRLGIWKMNEDEAELLSLAGLPELPPQTNRIRRLEFLAVRAMAAKMGIQAAEIAYLPSGKPFLTDNASSISISHTKNYVAVVLSRHALIGVDVEHATDRVRRIRHKFMHSKEEDRLKEVCNPIDETVGLLLHWCAKEAMFKAVPEEGVDFAQELQITEFSALDFSGSFKGLFLRTNRTFHIDYLVKADFVLTCSFSAESI